MVNKVILIGNIGRDPEIRKGQNYEMVSLALATSERWKDKQSGERKEKTEWHNITITNVNLIKIAQNYIKKGSKIYVEGVLRTKKYQNKQGQEVYQTYIEVGFNGTVKLLDQMSNNQENVNISQPVERQITRQPINQVDNQFDDIPF